MARYRKRPVVVDASCFSDDRYPPPGVKHDGHGGFYVTTIQGVDVRVRVGEWIIMEGKDDLAYPCANDVFSKTYEPDPEPAPSEHRIQMPQREIPPDERRAIEAAIAFMSCGADPESTRLMEHTTVLGWPEGGPVIEGELCNLWAFASGYLARERLAPEPAP